jgi:WD40 repeat protein
MNLSTDWPHSEQDAQRWKSLPTLSRYADQLAFSPDGKMIASYFGESLEPIKLWDVVSGKQLCAINLPKFSSDGESLYYLNCKSLFFSSDGKVLTYGGIIYGLALGKVVNVLGITSHLKEYPWQTVAVSPDLQVAVSTHNSTLKLWETSTGVDRHTFCLNEGVREIYVNQFSLDGKIFASLIWFAGYDGSSSDIRGEEKIKLWQVETGKELCSISLPDVTGETRGAGILAFSPDGRILASNCGDIFRRVIVLSETATGIELCRFQGFGEKNSGGLDRVTALAFSPDNQLLALGDSTGVISLWRLSKGWLRPLRAKKIRTLISCESCEPVKTLAFSSDGQTLASGLGDSNSGITLWNVKKGKKHKTFSGHFLEANKVSNSLTDRDELAVSPDGKTVACIDTAHSMIKLWDAQNGAFLRRIESFYVGKIVFSQNSKFLIGVQNNLVDYVPEDFFTSQNIIMWEVTTGRKVESIDYLSQGRWGPRTVNQHGDLLAIIDPISLSIKVLEVRTGQTLCTLRHGYQRVLQIVFSPDKRLLATRHSISEFAIWEITTGRLIRTIHTDNREGDTDLPYPDPVLFSPDGELLVIAATRNITVWQVNSGEKIHTIALFHRGWDRCMAFSPNGQTLAFTADTLRLWHVGTDQETCILEQPFYKITSLNFSENGQVLVSSYVNGTIKAWQQN